eukprot:CAMPEP_0175123926 /NCGR_PEP_ID=MMETSP0087-20121206/2503_1 /TAXON_ID=136419 /ORGANISM="Unknown Unknown, Strain D1" /LENGTH=745 /DNA_ID=CAMNT_0016405649 /DNA_START=149 /DNA_END=2383 /DNA_ORIENTATION=-
MAKRTSPNAKVNDPKSTAANGSTSTEHKNRQTEEDAELEEFKRIEETVQKELGYQPSPAGRNEELFNFEHRQEPLNLDEVPMFDDEDEWGELGDPSAEDIPNSPLKPQPVSSSRGILGLDPARHKASVGRVVKHSQETQPRYNTAWPEAVAQESGPEVPQLPLPQPVSMAYQKSGHEANGLAKGQMEELGSGRMYSQEETQDEDEEEFGSDNDQAEHIDTREQDEEESPIIQKYFSKSRSSTKLGAPNFVVRNKKAVCKPSKGVNNNNSKLEMLDYEISRYKQETEYLRKLQLEARVEIRHVREEAENAKQKLREQEDAFKKFKTAETKRLKKERLELEKQTRKILNVPDRKEREKIEEMEEVIANLKRELAENSQKSSLTIDRLNKKVAALTKEKKDLKDELVLAEKARLDEWEVKERKWKEALDLRMATKSAQSAVSSARKQAKAKVQEPLSTKRSINQQLHDTRERTKMLSSSNPTASIGTKANANFTSHLPAAVGNKENQPNPAAPRSSVSLIENLFNESSGLASAEPGVVAVSEQIHPGGKIDKKFSDGSRVITFPNGTTKKILPSGYVLVNFPNGDKKETFPDKKVVYFYASADTTHITFKDGLQVYHFSSQQTEKHFPDGSKEIIFADGTVKHIFSNGEHQSVFPDGTVQRSVPNHSTQPQTNFPAPTNLFGAYSSSKSNPSTSSAQTSVLSRFQQTATFPPSTLHDVASLRVQPTFKTVDTPDSLSLWLERAKVLRR